MDKLLTRIIHPETRIVDAQRGIVDYIASDETLDSYREIIRASGWRFTHFKKNAPFVNSHDYSSIENLVGKVLDFGVKGKQLVERVQWAIDVPENKLAQIGWKMTVAGYLKGVSVGFMPVKALTASDGAAWRKQLAELGYGMDQEAPRRIFVEQEQIELSAVIIGANPNAMAKARRDGAITEQDFEFITRSRSDRQTTVFFPSQETTNEQQKPMRAKDFLTQFGRLTGGTKSDFDRLTRAKNGSSEDEFIHALRLVVLQLRREQRLAGDPFASIVDDSELNFRINALVRRAVFENNPHMIPEKFQRSLSEDATPGSSLVRDHLGTMLYDILLRYGKWAGLNVQRTLGKGISYPIATAYPAAAFIINQGSQLADDLTAAALSTSGDFGVVAAYVNLSRQLAQDADADLALAFLQLFERAFNLRLDIACFNGNGVADADNGGITGIFQHADPALAVATVGNTTVADLEYEDFVRVISTATPAVLQREPRWWIHPAFLGKLFAIKAASGDPLLTTARETPSGTVFSILGFPVDLTAAAPSTDGASAKIAAFGDPMGYGVGLRSEWDVDQSPYASWDKFQIGVRTIGRARGDMLRASAFTILQTAAA